MNFGQQCWIPAFAGMTTTELRERFQLAEQFAREAKGAVKLALLVTPDMRNDPANLGVTVARNRGLIASAFDSEPQALQWLLDPNGR